jgi:hypothetical protein
MLLFQILYMGATSYRKLSNCTHVPIWVPYLVEKEVINRWHKRTSWLNWEIIKDHSIQSGLFPSWFSILTSKVYLYKIMTNIQSSLGVGQAFSFILDVTYIIKFILNYGYFTIAFLFWNILNSSNPLWPISFRILVFQYSSPCVTAG